MFKYELELIELKEEGYVRDKIVRKGTDTGLLNVPTRFIGKKFKMILIPNES